MWLFRSPIGVLRIQKTKEGAYGLWLGDMCYEACRTPEEEASNVEQHSTNCDQWDTLMDADGPSSLTEWEWVPDA